MDIAAALAHGLLLRCIRRGRVTSLAGSFEKAAGQFVRDRVHEKLGQQQSGRVEDVAPSIDMELHYGSGCIDDDLALVGIVDCTDRGARQCPKFVAMNMSSPWSRGTRFQRTCPALSTRTCPTAFSATATSHQAQYAPARTVISPLPGQRRRRSIRCGSCRPPRRLLGSLQLCTQAKDARRRHTLRTHLQNLDIRAGAIHPRPDPPDAGTEHLATPRTLAMSEGRPGGRSWGSPIRIAPCLHRRHSARTAGGSNRCRGGESSLRRASCMPAS